MEKKYQEFTWSIDTKLIHRISNESKSQFKFVLDVNSNLMELWKAHHEHLPSIVQSDGKIEELILNQFS